MATTRKVSRKNSVKKTKKPAADRAVETPLSQPVEHYIPDLNATNLNGGGNGAQNHANGGPAFEQIQRRAYELFAARGYSHGDDMADWFAAEGELRNSSSHAA